MQQYFDDDPGFRWEQAPRLADDDSYQSGYFDEITIDERLRRTAALDFVTTEHEPLFDAADILRLGKDLFCQHGHHQPAGNGVAAASLPGPSRALR